MSTKYIVNNISGQTITGDLTINGNIVITGTTNTRPYKVYTALLTQSGGDNPNEKVQGDSLELGVSYYISVNSENADLTVFGAPNSNIGTYFICTTAGVLPSIGTISLLSNFGAPVATVLENTIGNIWFTYNNTGEYYANSNNLFTDNKTTVFGGYYHGDLGVWVNYISGNNTSSGIYIQTGDPNYSNGYLNNTPIEIRVYN